jgi:hypothetical protein
MSIFGDENSFHQSILLGLHGNWSISFSEPGYPVQEHSDKSDRVSTYHEDYFKLVLK